MEPACRAPARHRGGIQDSIRRGGRTTIEPSSNASQAASFGRPKLRLLAIAGCALLIVYGTLFPFSGWRIPAHLPWPLDPGAGIRISTPDILTNLLLYMPLGGLLAVGRPRRLVLLLRAVLIAGMLSLGLETLQMFLPGRVSSVLDTSLNTVGACVGAGVVLALRNRLGRALYSRRTAWLYIDRVAQIGCAALAAWICAQLIPFVPSLDVSNVRNGLKPLWYALRGRSGIDPYHVLIYVAAVAALMLLATTLLRVRYRVAWLAAIGFLAILPLKVLVIHRQLSAEAFLGTLGGITLALMVEPLLVTGKERLAAALVVLCVLVEALHPGAGAMTHAFNWIPFRQQLMQPVNGLANLADTTWPFLALAYCRARRGGRPRPLAGALVVAVCLMALETAQYWIPGRYPDVTDVLVGAGAWLCASLYAAPTVRLRRSAALRLQQTQES